MCPQMKKLFNPIFFLKFTIFTIHVWEKKIKFVRNNYIFFDKEQPIKI
jgi:hypothetical protein